MCIRDRDVAEENGEIEPYPIDDVIDIVCEWNYELILDAEAHRSDPKDFNKQMKAQFNSQMQQNSMLMKNLEPIANIPVQLKTK